MRPSTRPTAAKVTAMSAATERTLVLVKPDGVRRGLVGEVLRRVEDKGYRMTALQMRTAGPDLLKEHYAEHAGKSFFGPLVEFMSSGPVVAAVVEGQRVIEAFRAMAGATDPVSYTHLRAHETRHDLVCRLLLEKKKKPNKK